jgi:solute carrier family 25 oxoglutarate transporter 11
MSWWDNAKPFVFGGMSGCTATTCIHPVDTLKVRIQVQGEMKGAG